MGLFGFGRKKHKKDEEAVADQTDETVAQDADDAADEAEDAAEAKDAADAEDQEAQDAENGAENSDDDDSEDSDDDKEELEPGPWDYDEDGVDPDDDDGYISFGSIFLPIEPGMTIRARRTNEGIQSVTVTIDNSSVVVVPLAAPKTLGLWDELSDELLESQDGAKIEEGRFGDEVMLPVDVKGKTMTSRVVGVDGPRWMLQGVFSGDAATADADDPKRTHIEDYFSRIIVRRGSEPLAPRDIIPIMPPKTAAQRRAEAEAAAKNASKKPDVTKNDTDVPQSYDVQHKVQTTMRRGPMFSEMR